MSVSRRWKVCAWYKGRWCSWLSSGRWRGYVLVVVMMSMMRVCMTVPVMMRETALLELHERHRRRWWWVAISTIQPCCRRSQSVRQILHLLLQRIHLLSQSMVHSLDLDLNCRWETCQRPSSLHTHPSLSKLC